MKFRMRGRTCGLDSCPAKAAVMKSRIVHSVLHVLLGVLTDAEAAYPEYIGIRADKVRITRYSQKRGLGFFTLDLPSLDALLLQGLETGRLVLDGPLSKRVSKRIQVPRLLSGLWLRVFDNNSCLRPDPDVTAIAMIRQITCLGKKLSVECSRARLQSARENYHGIEAALPPPNLQWAEDALHDGSLPSLCLGSGGDLPLFRQVATNGLARPEVGGQPQIGGDLSDDDRRVLKHIQQVADVMMSSVPHCNIHSHIGRDDAAEFGTGLRHGPGAVAERLVGPIAKMDFPFWPQKLESTFPFDLYGKMPSDQRERPSYHEGPSHLLFVPKTAKGPRIIAKEPVAHMWCQKAVRSWMLWATNTSIFGVFIDFKNQDLSGDLVLQASRDRSLATVDLSDASDRLSCRTVECVFRTRWSFLRTLHAVRTRYLKDSQSSDRSSFIKLKKFASQGTDTTFPVQSWVFTIIAVASCLRGDDVSLERIKELRNLVRVYGDDIIVPTRGCARLVRMLTLCGLKVNASKTYHRGLFRESCGVDGYLGDDVTPVKPKTLVAGGPESIQALIDTSNNLYLKGYWHASSSVLTLLPRDVLKHLEVRRKSSVQGTGTSLLTFGEGSELHLRKRWNKNLHRWEIRVWGFRPKVRNRQFQGFGPLLAHCTSGRRPGAIARIYSETAEVRRSVGRLSWEPSSGNYGVHREIQFTRDSVC